MMGQLATGQLTRDGTVGGATVEDVSTQPLPPIAIAHHYGTVDDGTVDAARRLLHIIMGQLTGQLMGQLMRRADLGVDRGLQRATQPSEGRQVQPSSGRHRHSTLPLAAAGCRSLGMHTVILLSLPAFFCQNGSVARGWSRPRSGSTP